MRFVLRRSNVSFLHSFFQYSILSTVTYATPIVGSWPKIPVPELLKPSFSTVERVVAFLPRVSFRCTPEVLNDIELGVKLGQKYGNVTSAFDDLLEQREG